MSEREQTATAEDDFDAPDAFARLVAECPTAFAEVILSAERVRVTARVPGWLGATREHLVRNGVPARAIAAGLLDAACAELLGALAERDEISRPTNATDPGRDR